MSVKIKIALFLSILFLSCYSVLGISDNKGANWDKTCIDGICTATIYSYDKYWYADNKWEQIDDSFYPCSELNEGSADGEPNSIGSYCTNIYNYGLVTSDDGKVTALRDGQNLSIRFDSLNGLPLSFNSVANGNTFIYENVIQDYVDLHYYFLPTLLKEEIIVKQPLPNEEDWVITFAKSGEADFTILPAFICDANGVCQDIPQEVIEDEIIITVPRDYLTYPELEYPLVIDPSLSVGSNSILWNGDILNLTNASHYSSYTRTSNPVSYLRAGETLVFGSELDRIYRAGIDWNMSAVPDGSVIGSITLHTFLTTSSLGVQNVSLNVTSMNGWSGSYTDNSASCMGNCDFYIDMGDGSIYNQGTYSTLSYLNISLSSQAALDATNSLSNKRFSIGFIGYYLSAREVRISGRDDVNASRRPSLTIVYGVNNTDANVAIEQGVNNTLSNNSIAKVQQVYIVNELNQHYLGNFDRTTILNNQTWAFNYILPTEFFTNIPSLFKVLNIWENQSLSFNEIVSQVGNFINATKY